MLEQSNLIEVPPSTYKQAPFGSDHLGFGRGNKRHNDSELIFTSKLVLKYPPPHHSTPGRVRTKLRKFVHLSALLAPILAEVTSKTLVLRAMCVIIAIYILEETLRLNDRQVPILTSFTLRMSHPEETTGYITFTSRLAWFSHYCSFRRR
jgi:hypothetical protein